MPGSRFCVAAFTALQTSMMLSPRCPSAGPIGGEGFALPAGTCNLMIPMIFFAIYSNLSRLSSPPRKRGVRACRWLERGLTDADWPPWIPAFSGNDEGGEPGAQIEHYTF